MSEKLFLGDHYPPLLSLKLGFFCMQPLQCSQSWSFGKEYVTFVKFLDQQLYCGLSDGSIHMILDTKSEIKVKPQNPLVGIDDLGSSLCYATLDGKVQVWDPRVQAVVHTIKSPHPLASLAASDSLIALGTELDKPDAGILIYDIRKPNEIFRNYMDSHNDDVTDVRFHPDKNAIISGSTDGQVNLIDLSIADQDDAIYQTVNHEASIHRVGFLSSSRFFALSHMETLSIYQVANPNEDVPEPPPKNFGDLREHWSCEYVADFQDNYFLAGSNNDGQLKLIPFDNEVPQLISAYNLEGAHNDEVARCFALRGHQLFTGGEDGLVKLWDLVRPEQESLQADSKPVPRKSGHKVTKKIKRSNPY